MTKLTDKKIKWCIDEVVKRKEKTDVVAKIQGVSQRRIQQLVAFYKRYGCYPTLETSRRPQTELTEEEKQMRPLQNHKLFSLALMFFFHGEF